MSAQLILGIILIATLAFWLGVLTRHRVEENHFVPAIDVPMAVGSFALNAAGLLAFILFLLKGFGLPVF